MKKMMSEEEYEKAKERIKNYSYLDLVLCRNEMLRASNINNPVYDLVEHELMKRNIEIQNSRHSGRGK